ncbi:MAG: hypothetical protein HQM12_23190 [SAR324 cluster bacterium]|nr:hypothetical protein [SAR324 cluster bacterium]
MLSKSQINRRLHQIPIDVWQLLLELFARIAHANNLGKTYLIDSFPSLYVTISASNAAGFIKRKSSCGLNESKNNISSVYDFSFDLPKGSYVHGDKAYNVYEVEDELEVEKQIHLWPVRKKNFQCPYEFTFVRAIGYIRKREQWFPKHIHAVTHTGFELKFLLFVLNFVLTFERSRNNCLNRRIKIEVK